MRMRTEEVLRFLYMRTREISAELNEGFGTLAHMYIPMLSLRLQINPAAHAKSVATFLALVRSLILHSHPFLKVLDILGVLDYPYLVVS